MNSRAAPRCVLFAAADDKVNRLFRGHGDLLEFSARPLLRSGGLRRVRPPPGMRGAAMRLCRGEYLTLRECCGVESIS